MQRSLPRWKLKLLCLLLLYCLNSSLAKAQLSYTFATGTTTYNAVSSATTLIGNNVNDELSGTTNIGFNFSYGCNTYTEFRASSNGWISLGASAQSSMPGNDLSTVDNGPIIAPLWDDLQTNGNTSSVYYKLTGSSPNRVLTVEWRSMRWDLTASGYVISFQAKLYEGTNVIEFIYSQNSEDVENGSASIGINGGRYSTDFYSVAGRNGTAVANYGTETNDHDTKPGTGRRYRWTPNNMTYVSSTTTQFTANVSKCDNMQVPILCLKVVTSGCSSPMTLSQIRMNMTGTANLANITAAHIYYTGEEPGFAPVNPFGGNIAAAGGTFSVNGTQQLVAGTNYFWITYDLATTLTTGALDAQCSQLTIAGNTQTPSVTNPTGTRSIVNCTVAPGGITNPSFWVKAGAGTSSTVNNTAINAWNDQSGYARHATSAAAAHQPKYYDNAGKNMNFNPVVDFDEAAHDTALADFMDINTNGILSSANNAYEVYAVITPGAYNLTKPGKFLFSGEAGTNNFNAFDLRSNRAVNDSWNMNDLIIGNTWATDTLCMLTFDYNYLRRESFKAGSSIGTLAVNPLSLRSAAALNGALAYQRTGKLEFYDGSIAEIITYANTAHSTTTREKVESYLGIKYGVTLAHNYVASNGTTVWNRSLNAGYNSNIIGIARDDNGALSQKQSKSTSSVQDILTVYIGPSKTVNQTANTGTFTAGDLSFFMVGSNNDYALASYPQTTERPAGICCRVLREWMVQKTNFTNTDVTLEFDFNSITPGYLQLNSADLRLLVDADGNFNNATILTTPTITVNAASGVATVRLSAAQFNSTPYFTLASVSSNTSLPLHLKAFSGLCKDEAIQLKWTTASPTQNDFTIERSHDKVSFSPAGTIKSNLSGNYVWADQSPLPGALYYRLKMTDDNGSSLYSAIITVNSCNNTAIQLSTNPVTSESTLMLQLPQNNLAEISLYDLLGRRFEVPGLTGKRGMERGVHYLPVKIPTTAAGMYLLYVTIGGERHVYRILKR